MRVGFAKDRHKIIRRRKGERGSGLGKLAHQNFGVLFNMFTMGEASDFKFGTQFGFAKSYHKITPLGKMGVALI